ncbi:MerR family transcriptional regulator [Ornithinibacillus sp. BX22]|uniref:MerR family transcriptional regulator n=2 Tax=Ornithinibacillus TaxID=484508 RepID=A0A923L2H7_9BACI|nr:MULTISPECIES: MerR family transcriptional regulator [Ornithinibacillus]MBC5635250.1 MerR family transcriptional regulator [Ornithinibacillus hominis]MBS3678823.1 MerR family transcriptional regulator [Ornithinibacillus massiliensis]
MHFTIQEFSNKTGLPPSKLRYYDKKGLLEPSTRLENGYRAYTPDQVHLAKMIDSLRQADIAMNDIRRYCDATEQEKKALLEQWKKDLDKRMEAILAARKYVGGIRADSTHTLLLSKWEKEKILVWQRVEADRSPHPFKQYFGQAKDRLNGQVASEHVYVKTEAITSNSIIGDIGFEVNSNFSLEEDDNIRLERVPPTLFAVLEGCRADDAFLCFSYIQIVIRYGFEPADYKLERYSSIDEDSFDYLIPIVK